MKISDTVWRDVVEEFYQLENYPNEEVLVKTDVCLRIARAKDIEPNLNLNGVNEKVIKFAFISGYE